jgi:hypothetical protein
MNSQKQHTNEDRVYWLGQIHKIDSLIKEKSVTVVPEFLVNMRTEASQCLNDLENVNCLNK